jgi:ribosomal protein S18 acetylase RimI-like enzyme
MIVLVPFTRSEFEEFLQRNIRHFARERVEAGDWTRREALRLSTRAHRSLLPQGLRTPSHQLRALVDARSGLRVGETWYQVRRIGSSKELWVYWIGIREDQRRKGYGLAALRRLEEEARRRSVKRIALHVFGPNLGARALYAKAGFQVLEEQLGKAVRPLPPSLSGRRRPPQERNRPKARRRVRS